MAHGEADHGCAQGEPCRPGNHDPQAAAKHRRAVGGAPSHPPEPTTGRPADRPDDDAVVPRQRTGEPALPGEPEPDPTSGCRSEMPGWAGAHRHGPVRPRQRATRRERPPRRWC
ncbi:MULTISPECIES: hypothetical protein [unclassified Micromonospora]|uniref:hypothetical protein n=1 Tax=unclassified Micromonospora TaxID=2617518 RepID=UPI000EF4937A|nr:MULTISPECIES: hypothetical protein [unclassified Micromonospora]RLP92252.1 hypothetical protein EAD89_09135 [Micromonospora sp. BL4]RLP92431.1 hypothetical protein EAD98_21510 [Micromonospora sp. CV4]